MPKTKKTKKKTIRVLSDDKGNHSFSNTNQQSVSKTTEKEPDNIVADTQEGNTKRTELQTTSTDKRVKKKSPIDITNEKSWHEYEKLSKPNR